MRLLKVGKFYIEILILMWVFRGWTEKERLWFDSNVWCVNLTRESLVLISFLVDFTHASVILKKGTLISENAVAGLYWGHTWGGIFLINDWCWKTHLTVGTAILGQVILICIKKQYEQIWRSKPVSGISAGILLQFHPWVPLLTSLSGGAWSYEPFFPTLLLAMIFGNRNHN